MARKPEITDEEMEREIAELESDPDTYYGAAILRERSKENESAKRRRRLYSLRYMNRIGRTAADMEPAELQPATMQPADLF